MAKLVFKSSEEGVQQLPEIIERLHNVLVRSHSDYDIDFTISISKISPKQYNGNRTLTDSTTSTINTSKYTKSKDNNKNLSSMPTSSIIQQSSGSYIDLVKLKQEQEANAKKFDNISRSLISSRPHRR
uniref:Ras-associating domain-containing protein n=1 Tax=Parastrongyloides trichosuri TaxID=131310 RepID=A0A0N4ZF47_PARTI